MKFVGPVRVIFDSVKFTTTIGTTDGGTSPTEVLQKLAGKKKFKSGPGTT